MKQQEINDLMAKYKKFNKDFEEFLSFKGADIITLDHKNNNPTADLFVDCMKKHGFFVLDHPENQNAYIVFPPKFKIHSSPYEELEI